MSETTLNYQKLFGFKELEDLNLSNFDNPLQVSHELHFVLDKLDFEKIHCYPQKFSQAFVDFVVTHKAFKKPLTLVDYHFKNQSLLVEAFIHTSFLNEFKALPLNSYERLEFLGDSVLGLLVSTHLMNLFEKLSEGELSRFRSSLVNGKSFAELANFLELGNCLILGKGELSSKGHEKEAILSDVFESLLGAIYRDGGFEAVNKSFYSLLQAFEDEKKKSFIDIDKLRDFDAKTRLQELTMAELKTLPEYKSTQLEDQSFRVDLYIRDEKVLSETNISKKKAERNLASKFLRENLLDNLKKINK